MLPSTPNQPPRSRSPTRSPNPFRRPWPIARPATRCRSTGRTARSSRRWTGRTDLQGGAAAHLVVSGTHRRRHLAGGVPGMRVRQTQPRHPRRRRTAQGEDRRVGGGGGAAMSGDGQRLEAWKKAGECRDFPQPWSDYLWSLEFEHRPGDAKAFIRRFAAVCLSWSKISYPKSALLLLPQQPNGETPPTRTAIAPNFLTFYFLQIRTAGSFDKEPAIILLSAATNAVCGADIGIIDFGNHERFILHDSPQLDPTACRLPRRRVVLRAARRYGRACSRRS